MPNCKDCLEKKRADEAEKKAERILLHSHQVVASVLALVRGLYESVESAGYYLLSEDEKEECRKFRLGEKISGIDRKE